ncbi:MAG: hypothetical protein ABIL58_16205 [Pseudomonadota bacterium]
MNAVQIQPDGWLHQHQKAITGDPLTYLNHAVTCTDAVAFRDYFRLLERYDVFTRINSFYPSTRKQYNDCPASGCTSADFNYLEFGKSIEMIGFPGEPRLEIYTSLKAVTDTERTGIGAFPLACMLDMPIRLGALRHVVFGDSVDIFEFDTVFTLFEFIDGIAWELSFQNMPITCELRR